jgi:hypothetical protein
MITYIFFLTFLKILGKNSSEQKLGSYSYLTHQLIHIYLILYVPHSLPYTRDKSMTQIDKFLYLQKAFILEQKEF